MREREPTVSIGLPVYNGENFLADTIESILGQTFNDLELVVSDNASTDATAEICARFAARDPRLRYHRNLENLGAARNYNRVVELARGRYFKWNGHDDPLPPNYLERCVAALEHDPTIVIAYGRPCPINERGRRFQPSFLVTSRLRERKGLASHRPHVRYLSCVSVPAGHPVGVNFGLVRIEVLRRTPLLGSFVSHDLPLLAEMALHGRAIMVPEVAQLRRYHPEQGHRTHRSRAERESWFDPARISMMTFPRVRLLREHFAAVNRATGDVGLRLVCYGGTLVWFVNEVAAIRLAKRLFGGLYRKLLAQRAVAGGIDDPTMMFGDQGQHGRRHATLDQTSST